MFYLITCWIYLWKCLPFCKPGHHTVGFYRDILSICVLHMSQLNEQKAHVQALVLMVDSHRLPIPVHHCCRVLVASTAHVTVVVTTIADQLAFCVKSAAWSKEFESIDYFWNMFMATMNELTGFDSLETFSTAFSWCHMEVFAARSAKQHKNIHYLSLISIYF